MSANENGTYFTTNAYIKVTSGKTYDLTVDFDDIGDMLLNDCYIRITYSQSINENEPDIIDM